ncbi:hypothetical protein NDU88_008077 [Pleurodeles waltl]|uniref:Uncharacterized protein n=1 Tax=Pleurodeles waltl TaxID=8319 RepID=A0AAV7VVF5_PLEWA|nr:hypothetical protein NDU88_008077 [Pleurodeles waltl]
MLCVPFEIRDVGIPTWRLQESATVHREAAVQSLIGMLCVPFEIRDVGIPTWRLQESATVHREAAVQFSLDTN